MLFFLCVAESDNLSVSSNRSNQMYNRGLGDSKSSINSGNIYGGQLSATESGREDDIRHEETESDISSTGSK